MTQPRTYNQIVTLLNIFASSHLQVKSWGSGFQSGINDLLKDNSELPILYFQTTGISLNTNTQDYNFRVYCLDLKQKDNLNSQDVLSDTAQILTDLRKWLINNFENDEIWSVQFNSNTLVPLNNWSIDYCVGWYIDITISSALIENDCDTPINTIEWPDIEPIQYDFLTCLTLPSCPTITTINETLVDLQEQIDNIPPFDCNELSNCQTIIDIEEAIDNNTPVWDTESNLIALDPTLQEGQIAYSNDVFYDGTDQPKFKIGNGTDSWLSLDYFEAGGDNFANADLTLTANRTHNADGFNINIENLNHLHISGESGSAVRFIIDAPNSTDPKILSWRTNNSQRWAIRVDGANDNFAVRRYDDSGSFIDAPISINRTNGQISFDGNLQITANDHINWRTSDSLLNGIIGTDFSLSVQGINELNILGYNGNINYTITNAGDHIFTTNTGEVARATQAGEFITKKRHKNEGVQYFTAFTTSTASSTYTIDCDNGNFQVITFSANCVLSFSNARVGRYQFIILASGATEISLATSAGWFTPAGLPLGFDNEVILMECVYDGTRMIVSTYENLSELV